MSDLVLNEEQINQLDSITKYESEKTTETTRSNNELRQVINQLYCSENFLISNESINSLIQQVCLLKDELFKEDNRVDCIHENFFTSLIFLCCYELLTSSESILINSLENISQITIQYLVDFLRRRQLNVNLDSVYTNDEVLTLIQALLDQSELNKTGTNSSADIDMVKVVTILHSSTMPELMNTNTTRKENLSKLFEQPIDEELSLNEIVNTFLSSNKKTSRQNDTRDISNKEICVQNEFNSGKNRPIRDVLKQYILKYFHVSNGLEVILNECYSSLAHLNAYRINQLNKLHSCQRLVSQKSKNSIEEAVNAKLNCSNLTNELKLLSTCLNLPIYDRIPSNECLNQMTHLVLSCQIAALETCNFFLILQHQNVECQQTKHSIDEQSAISDLDNLNRLSLQILDKFLSIMKQFKREKLYENLLSKSIYVVCSYLNMIIEQNQTILTEKSLSSLTGELDLYFGKLILMLNELFQTSPSNELLEHKEASKELTFGTLNLNDNYTKSELFNVINNTQQANNYKLFNLLMNIIQIMFNKILKKHKPLDYELKDQETQSEVKQTVLVINKPPVITTKQVAPPPPTAPIRIQSTGNEDSDNDSLLIGSWLNDQFSQANASNPSSDVNMDSENKSDSEPNLSNTTQILDTTFDINSLSERSSHWDVIYDTIELIENFVQLNTINKSFIEPLCYKHVKEICSMINSIETKRISFDSRANILLYNLIRNLILNDLLSLEVQDMFLDEFNLNQFKLSSSVSSFNLFINPGPLSVACQILTSRLNKEKNLNNSIKIQIKNVWFSLFDLLKGKISFRLEQKRNEEPLDDINCEHLALLLFLFYYLDDEQRKQVVLKLANTLTDAKELINSSICNYPPLFICRLLTILDYFLYYFDTPSNSLLKFVKTNLLQNSDIDRTDLVALKSIEDILRNLNSNNRHTSQMRLKPCFYSFSTGSNTINKNVLKILTEQTEELNYAHFYSSLVEFMKLSADVTTAENAFTNEELTSISLNIKTLWKLLNPLCNETHSTEVNFLLAPASYLNNLLRRLFKNETFDEFKPILSNDSEQKARIDYELMHFMRLAIAFNEKLNKNTSSFTSFYLNDTAKSQTDDEKQRLNLKKCFNFLFGSYQEAGNELNITNNLNRTLGSFTQFWNLNLKEQLVNLKSYQNDYTYQLKQDERLSSSINLLNFHLYFIRKAVRKANSACSNATQPSETHLNEFVLTLTDLVRLYKLHYKRFALLGDYFNDEQKTATSNLYLIALSASRLVSNQSKCSSFMIGFLNGTLFQDLNDYLHKVHFKKLFDVDTSDLMFDENYQVFLSFFYKWFQPAVCYQLLLRNLTTILHESFCLIQNDKQLVSTIETLFIELNGDLNCLEFLKSNVDEFLNSAELKKRFEFELDSKTKFDSYQASRVSCFTFETIFHMAQSFSSSNTNNKEHRFHLFMIDVLTYVENVLDTVEGLNGFCDFFSPSNHKRFFQFLLALSASFTDINFATQTLNILNKLFSICFKLNESKQNSNENAHLLNKLSSILAQLNEIEQLDEEFIQGMLSKLMTTKLDAQCAESLNKPLNNNENELRQRFALRQLFIYLAQDTNTCLKESTILFVLNHLITFYSKLVSTNETSNCPELIQLMDVLGSFGSARGHLNLFQASCDWINRFSQIDRGQLGTSNVGDVKSAQMMNTMSCTLSYVCNLLNLCKLTKSNGKSSAIYSTLFADDAKLYQEQMLVDFNREAFKFLDQIELLDKKQGQDSRKPALESCKTKPKQQQQQQQTKSNVQHKSESAAEIPKTNGSASTNSKLEQMDNDDDKTENIFDEEVDGDEEKWNMLTNEDNVNEETFDCEDEDNEERNNGDNNNNNDNDDDDNNQDDDDNDDDDDQDDNQFNQNGNYYDVDEDYERQNGIVESLDFIDQMDQNEDEHNINNDEDDEDDEEDDDDDDDDDDHDDNDDEDDEENFDEKSSYESASSSLNTRSNNKFLSRNRIKARIGRASSTANNHRKSANMTTSTNSNPTMANTTNEAPKSSTSTSIINQIDINEFLETFPDDFEQQANFKQASNTNESNTANVTNTINNATTNNNEDEEDYEEVDEDDDEYGDDFNDNFVIDYHRVENSDLIKDLVAQSITSRQTSESSTNGRDTIYQDLMSTITAAAAALNGRIQQPQAQQPQLQQPQSQVLPTAQQVKSSTQSKAATSADNKNSNSNNKANNIQVYNNGNEEDLNAQLCTYTKSKKDFMNQHWYYCHTCKMVDRIGVCSVCAKVCHENHDISYSKYGSFFCDCGAKEDGSCLAMSKRNGAPKVAPRSSDLHKKASQFKQQRSKIGSKASGEKSDSIQSRELLDNNNKNNTTTTNNNNNNRQSNNVDLLRRCLTKAYENKVRKLQDKLAAQIVDTFKSNELCKALKQLINNVLLPQAKEVYESSLLNSTSSQARLELCKLKNERSWLDIESQGVDLANETTNTCQLRPTLSEDQSLFIVTLGSQEGAFENVRMTYAGDHGQQIKQLIQGHSIRRVSMCCVATKSRKHLFVTHEKGRSSHFTILQLNALLKQDSNKRNKLTLTKLNTIPVPFTLISIVANNFNEDYIALTGLKDCYVMYLNENGQTKQELFQTNASSAKEAKNESTTQVAADSFSTGLIVLHPSLESSNYIIKTMWLPGSKTELALVTNDFIKIYDLSVDKISPVFYFLLPMGKIKDLTFVYDIVQEKRDAASATTDPHFPLQHDDESKTYKCNKYLVIMSSNGYMYYEEMNEATSAKNGVYYVTNTIDVNVSNLKDDNSSNNNSSSDSSFLFGGGVSVYYSFKLQLLFWSYQQGKNLVGSFKPNSLVVDKMLEMSFTNRPQHALCNWNEIESHPGLVTAMTYTTNNPVVFMFLPDKIVYQEIRLTNNQGGPSKAKILDMVATRHPSGANDNEDVEAKKFNCKDEENLETSNEKTTMIILCDDGSLKIYVANTEKTEYWLQPHLKPTNPIIQLKSCVTSSLFQLSPRTILNYKDSNLHKENSLKLSKETQAKSTQSVKKAKNKSKKSPTDAKNVQLKFPIDYFEKCSTLNDVEYGGADLLEIYNAQQLKTRLGTSQDKFLVSTSVNGYTLEITNKNDTSRLLMGCRIMCGSNGVEKCPTYFEVFNRRVPVSLTRQRWFDICLTREEAFIADNKLVLTVGPSLDSQRNIIIVDSCVCYAKSKDQLSWSKSEASAIQKRHNQANRQSGDAKPKIKMEEAESKKSEPSKKVSPTSNQLVDKQTPNELALEVYRPKPFDRLICQTIDALENCLLLSNSDLTSKDDQIESSYKISTEFMSLISPPIVMYKAKSFLFNYLSLLPSYSSLHSILSLFNNYTDDAVLSLIANSFKLNNVRNSPQYDYYTDQIFDYEILQKVLLVCKSLIQQQRANNLIKCLTDKFNIVANGEKSFISSLNELFWRVVHKYQLNNDTWSAIGQAPLVNLALTVEVLVEVMHHFLLVELSNSFSYLNNMCSFTNLPMFNLVAHYYFRLLTSDILDINFTTRRVLIQLLKPSKKTTSVIAPPAPVAVASASSAKPQQAAIKTPKSSSLDISTESNVVSSLSSLSSETRVDESMRFPLEVNENDEQQTFANENMNESLASTLISNASAGASSEDDMLQLALALSMMNTDQQQQQQHGQESSGVSSMLVSTQSDQSPRMLPESTNFLTQSSIINRQNSNELGIKSSKPTGVSKKKSVNEDFLDKLKLSEVDVTSPPLYLVNLNLKLYNLRKALLEKLSLYIESFETDYFKENIGLKSIAFFQCLLTLMADLNPKETADKRLLETIMQSLFNILKPLKSLSTSIAELDRTKDYSSLTKANNTPIFVRTKQNELVLICLRTISILLSKSKYQRSGDNCNFIIQTLFNHLVKFNMIDVCANLMKYMYYEHWKKQQSTSSIDSVDDLPFLKSELLANNGLIRSSNESKYYDELAPYFVRDSLNKDSFVIPPPLLSSIDTGSETTTSSSSNNATTTTTTTTSGSSSVPTSSNTANTTGNNANQTTTANQTPADQASAQKPKESSIELFDNYTELLTELLIRLPYQMKKLSFGSNSSSFISADVSSNLANQNHLQNLNNLNSMFDFSTWIQYLCEYLLVPQCSFLKRLIKKLLQILCGSKDKYRKFKDLHIMTSAFDNISAIFDLDSKPCPQSLLTLGSTIELASDLLLVVNAFKEIKVHKRALNLKPTYSNLIVLVENLKSVLEVALSRTLNWQRFCMQNPSTILYLMELTLIMGVDSNGSGVDSSGSGSLVASCTSTIVPLILQLLLCALAGSKQQHSSKTQSQSSSKQTSTSSKADKKSSSSEENLSFLMINTFFKTINNEIFIKFIRTYLLEAYQVNIRWTLHSLLGNIFKNTSLANQETLYELLFQMWPEALLTYGSKASQYVDLIGYFIIKLAESQAMNHENARLAEFLTRVIHLFKASNEIVATHPNSLVYSTLSNLMADFDGYYLEPNPCLICNNTETPITNFKLNAIKVDARFTTNQQIFKLTNTISISKMMIKISEIRKNKMVSLINVYYSNKSVQSIVDLKMNSKLWTRAKRVKVLPGQQDVKIEFQLPIIACNLIIEYADFYDRESQSNAETAILQCPRCSASVAAHPGVCNTCGENVFQCHKCRAINYDERDPFLCNSCGFCKFAKFDYTIVGRMSSAVDPIENEEDRKQTIQNINSLLDRADKVYTNLSQFSKPALEALIIKFNENTLLEKYMTLTDPNQFNSLLNSLNSNASLSAHNSTNTHTGVIGIRLAPLTLINNTNQQQTTSNNANKSIETSNQTLSTGTSKLIQSVVQKYSIECKSKFDELAKIITKLNLSRNELREYDKQFKSINVNVLAASRKNSIDTQSTQAHAKNNCFGCASASVDFCLNLFRALLCSSSNVNQAMASSSNVFVLAEYAKRELCRHGILEELVNFNLKRTNYLAKNAQYSSIIVPPPTPIVPNQAANQASTTTTGATTTATTTSTNNAPTTATATTTGTSNNSANNQQTASQQQQQQTQANQLSQRVYDREIINLIYLLMKDNHEGTYRFSRLLMNKVDAFLTSTSQKASTVNTNSPLRYEMLLLSALLTKQDDLCWESRLRLVIEILVRSLSITSHGKSLNPIVVECLTLPCLRILYYVSNQSTNMSLLSQLGTKFSLNTSALSTPTNAIIKPPSQFANNLNRFYSEPADPNQLANNVQYANTIRIDADKFIQQKSQSYYEQWLFQLSLQSLNLSDNFKTQLKIKYFNSWRNLVLRKRKSTQTHVQESFTIDSKDTSWFKYCLFCPSSRAIRQLASNILQNLFTFYAQNNQSHCSELNNLRKFQLAELTSEYLDACSQAGEWFGDYFNVFKTILNDKECKYRLVVHKAIFNNIESLILKEIKHLNDLERVSMTSTTCDYTYLLGCTSTHNATSSTDLTLGYSVKCLSETLSILLKETNIKNRYKSRLIATVLNSYLSLKKLVFVRTKLIDEAQERFLSILEQITSGTESETRKFMSICIKTIENFDLDDLVTPVYIFERLCNIIYPEETVDNKEFLLFLEKDPNQEDYLQGRMLGNPYSSNEPGLGPLMRNIKNKICTDSELIALLDDDNGMELLVNNKIISLDLPVKDVYKKVWLAEVLSEHEPMRIVYRMTGLSGDATEDIIDNLDDKKQDAVKNDEEIYRMADELANCDALNVMLERLACINQQNFTFGKSLLSVLLKLFDYALKISVNRKEIIKPEMKAITTMLQTLNMMLIVEQIEPNKIGVNLAEQLLNIMELILSEASKQPSDIYNEFSALCGDTEQLEFLLNNIKCTFVRSHTNLLQALMRLIPFLSFGDEKKMKSLIAYFSTYYSDFNAIDKIELVNNSNSNNIEELLHLECFCVIVNGIEIGEMGKRLRDMMKNGGVVDKSIEYLLAHAPQVTTYLNSDYDVWKEFINRNSLPYVLRILTGLCRSHEVIQEQIGESCIPILHKLESSGHLVGILAEDLLLALKQNESSKVAAKIEEVRNQTKIEKKKLAMAMRKKQLSQLGMKTNEKGQLLTANPSTLKNVVTDVEEEKGHICCICREGYKYHPQKVLAIYTFSKKCELEPQFEAKSRKSIGYSTVTHFNLVHIDCHTNAIRSSRTCRDEWENAALQNANTKCNGILPIWGPDVSETVFSNALARHNSYLLEATSIRDSSYILYIHDLRLLLNRFSENLSFSEDSGGGGRESNINLIPYLIHAVLYSVNTAKYISREEKNLNNYLEASEKVSNAFECENVFYFITLSLIVMNPSSWTENRIKFVQRLLLTTHARLVNSPSLEKQKLNSTNVLEFKKYKSSLLFYGLANLLFKHIHEKVKVDEDTSSFTNWNERLANYIRRNDIFLMDSCKKVLKEFEEELLVCEDWTEFFDVLGLLHDINDPVEFTQSHLSKFV